MKIILFNSNCEIVTLNHRDDLALKRGFTTRDGVQYFHDPSHIFSQFTPEGGEAEQVFTEAG